MSPQLTSPDTPNTTFSRASADGPSPFVSPDGRILDPHGLARALASLSARQVKALDLRTSGIYGPPGSTSSRSVGLQSSLESRLRALLSGRGSTLYTLTWKAWATPSGVSRFRLRGSAPRTSATEPTGWPTPAARDYRSEEATDEFNEKRWAHPRGKPLTAVATLAGWPTPRQADGEKNVRSPEGAMSEIARKGAPQDLSMAAAVAGPARYTASGEVLTGSSARMDAGGQLNPEHSRWLMGYPPAWASSHPSFADWRKWQDLMQRACDAQRATASSA